MTTLRLAVAASALAAVAGVLTTPRSARAEKDPVAVRYDAPAQCPSAAYFRARVEELTVGAGGNVTAAFRVSVRRAGRRFGGTLTTALRERGGRSSARSVDGASCEEVVEALALVAALAIDPEAFLSPVAPAPPPLPHLMPPLPQPPPAPGPDPARDRDRDHARDLDHAREPEPEPEPSRSPLSLPAGTPPRPLTWARPTAPPPPAWHGALEIAFDLHTGVAPTILLGGGLALSVERDVTARLSFALYGGGGITRSAFEGTSPVADYTLVEGWLGACPLRVRLGSRVLLAPCAQAEAGGLSAVTVTAPKGVTFLGRASPFWLDVAALGRIAVRVAGPLWLQADGGAALAVTEPTFVFDDPRQVVHQVPFAGAIAAIGANVTLW